MSEVDVQHFDNTRLRAALDGADVRSAAEGLRTGGVLLARVEVGPDDRRVMVATGSDGARTLIAFTSTEAALRWEQPELVVAVVLGPDLVDVLDEQAVPSVLLDPAGPRAVAFSAEQLRAVLAQDGAGGVG